MLAGRSTYAGFMSPDVWTFFKDQPAALPVNLVYTANRFLPIKVRAFLDFAAPRLKRVFAKFQPPA